MELDDLLNAILEVTQAVARIPCTPQDKKETLACVKKLFVRYNAVSTLFNTSGAHAVALEKTESATPDKEHNDSASGGSSGHVNMQEKLHSMEKKLRTVEEKISRMEKERGENGDGDSLSSLRSEFVAHKTTLAQMRFSQDSVCNRVSRVENTSNELELLQNRIGQINSLVEKKSDRSSIADELLRLRKEIASLKGLQGMASSGTDNVVAFSAAARNHRSKRSKDYVIQFRNVAFDSSNCFDPKTSTFKSKFLGWYVFSTSISTNSPGEFEAAIVHNENEIALFGTPGNKDLQTGTSTVVQLQIGDTVCVKVRTESEVSVEIGSGFSNFIGYKIA